MFVRKTSYDTVVSERDRLSVEVARLKAELRIANGEITSLKFRFNDVSFLYDQMLKAGEKKVAQVVENRGVYFEVIPAKQKSWEPQTVASTIDKHNNRSIRRTVRENDVYVDYIQQTSDTFAGFAAAVAVVADMSYNSSSASSCRADSDGYSSSGSSSCSNNDTSPNTESNYQD